LVPSKPACGHTSKIANGRGEKVTVGQSVTLHELRKALDDLKLALGDKERLRRMMTPGVCKAKADAQHVLDSLCMFVLEVLDGEKNKQGTA